MTKSPERWVPLPLSLIERVKAALFEANPYTEAYDALESYLATMQAERPSPALDRPLGPRAVEFYPDQSVIVRAEAAITVEPPEGFVGESYTIAPHVVMLTVDAGAEDYRFNMTPRIARFIADMLNVEADEADPTGERIVPMYRPNEVDDSVSLDRKAWGTMAQRFRRDNPKLPDMVTVGIRAVSMKPDGLAVTVVDQDTQSVGHLLLQDDFLITEYLGMTLGSGVKEIMMPRDGVNWE